MADGVQWKKWTSAAALQRSFLLPLRLLAMESLPSAAQHRPAACQRGNARKTCHRRAVEHVKPEIGVQILVNNVYFYFCYLKFILACDGGIFTDEARNDCD